MKVISLLQPWASLVVVGAKHWETRSWQTKYRGLLAIHASKKFDPVYSESFRSLLAAAGYSEAGMLPLGAIIGTVVLVDIQRATIVRDHIDTLERQLGDYSSGRFAWKFSAPARITPVPARGSLGLWEYPLA